VRRKSGQPAERTGFPDDFHSLEKLGSGGLRESWRQEEVELRSTNEQECPFPHVRFLHACIHILPLGSKTARNSMGLPLGFQELE
jgi:hypothetical protein